MDQRAQNQTNQMLRLTAIVMAVISLAGCQKARMSSIPKPQPAPLTYRPPIAGGGTPFVPPPTIPVAGPVPQDPGYPPIVTVVPPPSTTPTVVPTTIPTSSPIPTSTVPTSTPTVYPTPSPTTTTIILPPPTVPTVAPTTVPTIVPTVTPGATPGATPTTTPTATIVATPGTPVPSTTTPATPVAVVPGTVPQVVPVGSSGLPPITPAPVLTGVPLDGGAPIVVTAATPIFGTRNKPDIRDVHPISPTDRVILSGCQKPDCSGPVIQAVAPPPPPTPSDCRKECTAIPLRATPLTNKLDILFVVDTSYSMTNVRVQIARQMTNFINELAKDVDYNIAVMLGHGPRSKTHPEVGSLFVSSDKVAETKRVTGFGDQLVFKSSQFEALQRTKLKGTSETSIRTEAMNAIATALAQKMLLVPNDESEAQGEAGLLNLYTSLTNPSRLHDIQQAGFLRDDAALAVIFVADENDVCYDHSLTGAADHYNTLKDHQDEQAALQAGDVCRSVAQGQPLKPEHVYQALQNVKKDMPVILTGILYPTEASIVQSRDPHDKYFKDKEIGHGYMDLIALGHGVPADLGKADFGKSLVTLGGFADFASKYQYVYALDGIEDTSDIDESSIVIPVVDAGNSSYQEINKRDAHLEIGKSKTSARLVIDPPALEKIYKDGHIHQGAQLRPTYKSIRCQQQAKSGQQPAQPAPIVERIDSPQAGAAQAPTIPAGATVTTVDHGQVRSDSTPAKKVDICRNRTGMDLEQCRENHPESWKN